MPEIDLSDEALTQTAAAIADDDFASEANGYASWWDSTSCSTGYYSSCCGGGGKHIDRHVLRDGIAAALRAVRDAARQDAPECEDSCRMLSKMTVDWCSSCVERGEVRR